MKRLAALAFVAVLAALSVNLASAQASVTVTMSAGRDGPAQTGTAVLTEKGNQTEVVLNVSPPGTAGPQPAHIHQGDCPGVGPVAFPLTSVVDGKSTTVVSATLQSLLTGGFAINVHKSAAEANLYTSCGKIAAATQTITVTMMAGRDQPAQTGTAVLTARGNQTEVVLNVAPQSAVAQPAHIHAGVCPTVGAVVFPLTSVVAGTSTTIVDTPLTSLLNGTFAINVHKSAGEANIYTSCGNIVMLSATPATAPAAPAPSTAQPAAPTGAAPAGAAPAQAPAQVPAQVPAQAQAQVPASLPKTGDPVLLWLVSAAAGGMITGGAWLRRRKS